MTAGDLQSPRVPYVDFKMVPHLVSERPPPVVIRFKASSTGKGAEGYEVTVSSEATSLDVERTIGLAEVARQRCLDILKQQQALAEEVKP